MKRSVINECNRVEESLSNHCAVFSYRLKNLCVKAEEVSLIPVEVPVDDEIQKLEDCTVISKKDDYNFMIFPTYDEDLQAVSVALMQVHPEFKQKVDSMKVQTVDRTGKEVEVDARYILVTMPDVDDDRYDVLKDGVKACYEECKAQMEVTNAKADVKLAELTVDESKEDMELLKQCRDKINETWGGQCDKIYQEKLQEIEDAHNKWLAERYEKEQQRKEDEASHSDNAAHSMKIEQDDMSN